MGVKLTRPLFMGIHLQLAPSKGVFDQKLSRSSIFKSTINGFQQHSTKDELDCKDLKKCCLCTNPNFHQ